MTDDDLADTIDCIAVAIAVIACIVLLVIAWMQPA
jgi:hypothetical protein